MSKSDWLILWNICLTLLVLTALFMARLNAEAINDLWNINVRITELQVEICRVIANIRGF